MNKKQIITLLSAAALMSSCGLYNKYERPDNIDTKGIIRDAVSNTDTLAVNDTTSFGNLPWQSVFTDPQLQALSIYIVRTLILIVESAAAHQSSCRQ